jgi:hypothetical protein
MRNALRGKDPEHGTSGCLLFVVLAEDLAEELDMQGHTSLARSSPFCRVLHTDNFSHHPLNSCTTKSHHNLAAWTEYLKYGNP